MLSWLKKNRTVRSLLATLALSSAGAPVISAAAEKAPQKAGQSAVLPVKPGSSYSKLVKEYEGVRHIFEGNLCYCYDDNGYPAGGCGVRFKGFSRLNEYVAIKVTPKKGCMFFLEDGATLSKMANANWDLAKTFEDFPQVESVQKIKLKDCKGARPKPTDKLWGDSLILFPATTMDGMNRYTAAFFVDKACSFHPNLFQLPLPDQLVVVDVIYNLGNVKYGKLKTFPKFKKAIQNQNLNEIKEQCGTGNKRRDCMRKSLADIPLTVNKPGMTKPLLTKTVKESAVKRYSKIEGEKEFWNQVTHLSGEAFDAKTNKQVVQKPVRASDRILPKAGSVKAAPVQPKKVVSPSNSSQNYSSKTGKNSSKKQWTGKGR